jgi:hypothetical protein
MGVDEIIKQEKRVTLDPIAIKLGIGTVQFRE